MSLEVGKSYKFIAWDPETTLVFAAGQTFEETQQSVLQLPEEVDTSEIVIAESPPKCEWRITLNEYQQAVAVLHWCSNL